MLFAKFDPQSRRPPPIISTRNNTVPMVTRVGMDLSQFLTTISLRQGEATRCAALPMFDAMRVPAAGPICRDKGQIEARSGPKSTPG